MNEPCGNTLNWPCANTLYESLHNPIELSPKEAIRLDALLEETASEELLGSSELIDDMLTEHYDSLKHIMTLALEEGSSYHVGMAMIDLKDSIIARIKKMDKVWLKANDKLNEEMNYETNY